MANKLHFYDIAQRVVQQIRRYVTTAIDSLELMCPKHDISESESKAHQTLRSYPGNANKAERSKVYGIEHPGSTGVIYVMDRAMQHGFTYGDSSWGKALFTLFSAVLCLTMFLIANFGQGAPEGMINK